MQFRKVSIPGLNIEVEVNRIGMSGTLAYEIRGLKEDGPMYIMRLMRSETYGIKEAWMAELSGESCFWRLSASYGII